MVNICTLEYSTIDNSRFLLHPGDLPRPSASRRARASAAASIKPLTGALGFKVLKYVRSVNASTSDQAEVALGMSHQTCSARFNELAGKGLLEETGRMSRTRSGRFAAEWQLTSKARIHLSREPEAQDEVAPRGQVANPGPRIPIVRTPVRAVAS